MFKVGDQVTINYTFIARYGAVAIRAWTKCFGNRAFLVKSVTEKELRIQYNNQTVIIPNNMYPALQLYSPSHFINLLSYEM